MLRRTSWLIASLLVVLAAIAAVAAAPPSNNLTRTLEAQRRLATERPDDAGVQNDLGNLLVLVGQPAEAETAYRRALELDPQKVSALYNLGLLLQQRGELREAMKLYQQAVELDGRHAWAHYQMGSIQEAWKQNSKAVDSYARAFSLDPQLAFPEVNPQVVENKLLTEAMLQAYRDDSVRPQAPKVYDDPNRIASLLVPPPASAQPDQTAQQQPAQAQPGQANRPTPAGTTAGRAPATTGRPQPGQPQGGPTVIRERDLDRNPAGQAQPQGARPQAGYNRGAPRGLREWSRPEPTIQEVPTEDPDVDNDGGQPQPVITPPPGGVYYRPGIQSTGRLNLQVMPDRLARAGRR